MFTSNAASAGEIRANGGTTFNLVPTADPSVFTHTVDGLAQVSLVGNCAFHADVLARFPAVAGQPIALSGTFTFTSADGASVLRASVEGAVNFDPANPAFVNFGYQVVFIGGTGQFANARGRAEVDGAGLFTSASTGTATWKLKGEVHTRNRGKK